MKKLLVLVAICIGLSFGAAQAQTQEKVKTPQQSKMALCNKEATGKKGDERKLFMKTCLSAGKQTQPDKAKS